MFLCWGSARSCSAVKGCLGKCAAPDTLQCRSTLLLVLGHQNTNLSLSGATEQHPAWQNTLVVSKQTILCVSRRGAKPVWAHYGNPSVPALPMETTSQAAAAVIAKDIISESSVIEKSGVRSYFPTINKTSLEIKVEDLVPLYAIQNHEIPLSHNLPELQALLQLLKNLRCFHQVSIIPLQNAPREV